MSFGGEGGSPCGRRFLNGVPPMHLGVGVLGGYLGPGAIGGRGGGGVPPGQTRPTWGFHLLAAPSHGAFAVGASYQLPDCPCSLDWLQLVSHLLRSLVQVMDHFHMKHMIEP